MNVKFTVVGQHMCGLDTYLRLYMKRMLKPFNLNTAEGMVLLVLYGSTQVKLDTIEIDDEVKSDGMRIEHINQYLHYDKGVMTRTMQSLEEKGYVTRSNHSKDKRSFSFHLTHQALSFQPTIVDIMNRWSEDVLEGISNETLELLEKSLGNILDNAVKKYKRGD